MSINSMLNQLKGVGVGLRTPHVNEILTTSPDLAWFELLTDNHLAEGGWARRQAIEVAKQYPVTMHCVGMSIGSVDPINFEYLDKIKALASEIKPKLISDHLCWSSLHSHYSHDLLPLPYTEEALKYLCERIKIIQDYLGVQIAVENISAYLAYKHSTISEVEFINQLAELSDSFILLDINNVYVNQKNIQLNSSEYIEAVNIDRVAEIHLAGFEDKGDYYLDSHNKPVNQEVWELYADLIKENSTIPTLIEWDHDIPEFEVLCNEANKAKNIISSVENRRVVEDCREVSISI